MDEVPIIEPLVCKKISHERLTVLHFREDCLVTACQEGFICTWARPGHVRSPLVNHPVNASEFRPHDALSTRRPPRSTITQWPQVPLCDLSLRLAPLPIGFTPPNCTRSCDAVECQLHRL